MSPLYKLRPFGPEDYEAVVELGRIVFGDTAPMDAETLRRIDARRSPDDRWGRLVTIHHESDTIYGMAQWGQPHGADYFYFWIAVHPEHKRQGLKNALLSGIIEGVAPHRPKFLETSISEDDSDTVSFLTQNGFEEVMRSWPSRLSLAEFQPEQFSDVEKHLPAQGIFIQTLSQIGSDQKARHRLYETMNTLWADVPSPNPYLPPPFERWERGLQDSYLPDGFFIAVEQASGEYVGVSTLSKVPGSDHLDTYLTGVRREYRRRGIALALKVRAAQYARSIGAPVIRTGNATTNLPMLAINERLGFQRQEGRIRFVRHLLSE